MIPRRASSVDGTRALTIGEGRTNKGSTVGFASKQTTAYQTGINLGSSHALSFREYTGSPISEKTS